MRTWTQDAPIPAAAITLATGNTSNQPIIFTSQFGNKGTHKTTKGDQEINLEWVIKSIDLSLTRDWSVSTCMIVLTCTLPNAESEVPPLPDVSMIRGGNYPYVWCEDEIRIYMGYIDSPSTPISADMLDEYPFDFDTLDGTVVKHNPEKNLVPVFWGFIDKVEFSGNNQGLNMVLGCRDRARIFADTRLLSIQAFSGSSSGSTIEEGFSRGDIPSILMQVAANSGGNTTDITTADAGQCQSWKPIKRGLLISANQTLEEDLANQKAFPNPTIWTRQAALSLMSDKSYPRFHIWSEKPPIVKGEPNAIFSILKKTPLEIIDSLAKSEDRPTDFYCSHVNGDFIFGPRALDESGFNDEVRNYRTYFFKSYPKQLNSNPPAPTQMIISIRAVSSTIGTFNKFVVVGSQANGAQDSLLESIEQSFSTVPYQLANRLPGPPSKTQIIYDGAISIYDNPAQGALIVGLAASRIFGRDINSVQLELIGDPTWFPNEAIRVYNSVIHDKGVFVTSDQNELDAFQRTINADAADVVNNETRNKQEIANVCGNNDASKLADRMYNQNPGRVLTDLGSLVLPKYKARTIIHKFTATGKRGWTTTIHASADF